MPKSQIPAILTLAFGLVFSSGASAMQFTVAEGGVAAVIRAEGAVEEGDETRLREVVEEISRTTRQQMQRQDEFRLSPIIEFNSPGGNLFAGLKTALVIRELGLRTRVPEGNICMSACTYAFLGGIDRRSLGRFGIHAVSTGTAEVRPETLDEIQEISSILVAFTRELVGASDMAEAGLRVRAADIYELSDEELRDWKVITHVSRPAQRFSTDSGPLSRCTDSAWREEIIPNEVICADLTAGSDYIAIGAAIGSLRGHVDPAILDGEQERFEQYWRACETSWMGKLSAPQQIRPIVENCMREAFAARSAELGSLLRFFEVSQAEPAMSGWKSAP